MKRKQDYGNHIIDMMVIPLVQVYLKEENYFPISITWFYLLVTVRFYVLIGSVIWRVLYVAIDPA